VVETLKQDERTSHIPIILLTAKATQEDKVEGLRFGADAYLTKPFDKEELLVRLQKLLEIRQKLQQKFGLLTPSSFPETPSSPDEFFLQKMRQLIETHLSDAAYSVEDLASDLQMSRSQLHRKLVALSNQSPSEFIRAIRMEKAKVLLKSSSLNISEIAYEVGYTDPNYFIRSFTKSFRISPNEFRKSL